MAEVTTILLVEDYKDIRELLSVVLESAGYNVIAVENPRHALEILETHPVDALITDYNLPEMTGVKLIKTAREQHPELRMMLISGQASLEALAKSCAIRYWFRKGEPVEQFQRIVGAMLDGMQPHPSTISE